MVISYQHHHDLPRDVGGADQDVPQEATAGELVVHADLVAGQPGDDGLDDAVGPLVLDQAAADGHDPVGAHGIYAAVGEAALIGAEHRVHLVAVVEGIFHPDDGLHRAQAGKQRLDLLLLEAQLLGVGEAGKLAAAAAGGNGAGKTLLLRPARGGRHGGPVGVRCGTGRLLCGGMGLAGLIVHGGSSFFAMGGRRASYVMIARLASSVNVCYNKKNPES